MYKAYDKVAIQSVIDEYRLSDIQSESEVRSKFIVRLSEVLGYSSQFRGEEFPVYGYGGREPLRAKDADFIFFNDKSFGSYRENTQKNKAWVREHSLLVIEANRRSFGRTRIRRNIDLFIGFVRVADIFYGFINGCFDSMDFCVCHTSFINSFTSFISS